MPTDFNQSQSCSDDTTCSQNRNGFGLQTCRKRFDVGAVCTSDDNCKPHLKCSEIYPYRRCYDPKLSLRVGEKCNPNVTSFGKMCVQSDDFRPMACLPKGKVYVCQKLAELYERCDPRRNVGCSPRSMSVCSQQRVCVPRM